MQIVQPSAALIDNVNRDEIYQKLERCGKVSRLSKLGDPENFIRSIIKRGHESVLEHVNLTFHIVCDRAIMSELTRHRHASFTVESTRYLKYTDLKVIAPTLNAIDKNSFKQLVRAVQDEQYGFLLKAGYSPDVARSMLPLCTKSELYMTANLREWRHIIKVRTAPDAHPQIRLIIGQVRDIIADQLPVIVEDLL